MRKQTSVIKIVITTLLILFMQYSIAQKYSTQSGYEKYFIENFAKLDPIEGIWKQHMVSRIVETNEYLPEGPDIYFAVIYEGIDSEGNKIFGEYKLENGRYDPGEGISLKYRKYKDYNLKYIKFDQAENNSSVKVKITPFILLGNIKYNILMGGGNSASLSTDVVMYKSFPFEGDVK